MKLLLVTTLVLFSSLIHAISIKDWKDYSSEQKINYINATKEDVRYSITQNKILKVNISQDRLSLVGLDLLIKKLTNYPTSLDTDIHDEDYSTVGEVEAQAHLLFSDENHFLGAYMDYVQVGCSHMDENDDYLDIDNTYYPTVAEAEENSCFDNDVSWNGFSIVDESFNEIQSSQYMIWSGH